MGRRKIKGLEEASRDHPVQIDPAFLQIRNDCSHFASQQRQGAMPCPRSSLGKRRCSWRLSLLTPDPVLGTGGLCWLHDSQAPRVG